MSNIVRHCKICLFPGWIELSCGAEAGDLFCIVCTPFHQLSILNSIDLLQTIGNQYPTIDFGRHQSAIYIKDKGSFCLLFASKISLICIYK